MPSLKGWSLVALVVVLSAGVARAGDGPRQAPRSIEELAHMNWPELEALYRAAGPCAAPAGYCRGLAIYCPDAPLAGVRSKVTHCLWKGKHFSACDGTLVNQWCGAKAIKARVYPGESWLDGGPSLVMDYGDTSWVWRDVRDELREVAPGLYLGAMYRRAEPSPKFKMFFALECARP